MGVWSRNSNWGIVLSLFTKWSRHYLIFFLVGLFSILFLNPSYTTNDNSTFSFILNGSFTGKPDEHLIFINVGLGLLLKYLYILDKTIPWFPIMMFLNISFASSMLSFISFQQITKTSLKSILQRTLFAAIFIVLIVFHIRLIVNVNYTSAGFWISSIGILCFLITISTPFSRLSIFASVLLFISGYSWRPSVFYPVLLIILASSFPIWFRVIRSRRAVLMTVLVMPVIALNQFDIWWYDRSPDWAFFRTYNLARGALHGIKRYGDLQPLFISKRTGVSLNEIFLLNSWIADPSIQSLDHLERIVDLTLSKRVFFDVNLFTDQVRSLYPLMLVSLFFCVTLFFFSNKKLGLFGYFVSSAFVVLGIAYLFTFLLLNERLPVYVTTGVLTTWLLATGATLLSIFLREASGAPIFLTKAQTLQPTFFCLLTLSVIFFSVSISSEILARSSRSSFQESLILSIEDQSSFVALNSFDPFGGENPYTNFRYDRPEIPPGWTIGSPLMTSRIEKLGLNGDLASLIASQRLLLPMGADSMTWNSVLRERFNSCGRFEPYEGFQQYVELEPWQCEIGWSVSDTENIALGSDVAWVTTPEIYLIGNTLSENSDGRLTVELYSPFGVYAKPINLKVSYITSNSLEYNELIIRIDPKLENKLVLDFKGQYLKFESLSPCVVPSSIDGSTDNRTLCWGFNGISIQKLGLGPDNLRF